MIDIFLMDIQKMRTFISVLFCVYIQILILWTAHLLLHMKVNNIIRGYLVSELERLDTKVGPLSVEVIEPLIN